MPSSPSIVDPSSEAKQQIADQLSRLASLLDKAENGCKSDQLTSKEFDDLLTEIQKGLRSAVWDLKDLSDTLSLLEKSSSKFAVSPLVVADRRDFIQHSHGFIEEARKRLVVCEEIRADWSTIHMAAYGASGGFRYTRLSDSPTSSNHFVSDVLQKQELIMKDQDEDLEKVGDSVHILKNMSHRIGNELEDQAIMLDELGTDMERTDTGLGSVMKKIAKVTNLNDDKRQCKVIIILSGILVFLILLLIVL